MNIPFHLKAKMFRWIDRFELYDILQWAQENITKRSVEKFTKSEKFWNLHLNGLVKYGLANKNDVVCLEIGAGQSLSQNIFLSKFIKKQVVVDIRKLLRIKFVNSAIRYIYPDARLIGDELDLQKEYGISYVAPCNIVYFPFPHGTFDAVYSTNVFEHIPKTDLEEILIKFNKILKSNGLLSLIIDYTDHYSHTDKNLDKFHFRKFTDEEWDGYNFKIHYQNRLNHSEYINSIRKSGFEVIEYFNIEDGDIVPVSIKSDCFAGAYIVCQKLS